MILNHEELFKSVKYQNWKHFYHKRNYSLVIVSLVISKYLSMNTTEIASSETTEKTTETALETKETVLDTTEKNRRQH